MRIWRDAQTNEPEYTAKSCSGRTVQRIVSVFILAMLFLMALTSGPRAQEEDPATSCDVRKAGLDPKKFHVYLTKDTPYQQWSLFPGKKAVRPAGAPHGPQQKTYVNPVALRSIDEGKGMAFGSLIVTEDLGSDGNLVKLSAMLKIKGYNPGEGDWHWFQYDAKGAVLACGRTPSCISCHRSRRENDYLMTAPITR
jgi:hypothetical protein